MLSARRLHRLDGRADRPKIKIALLSGGKPPWFGVDGPPDAVPLEVMLDRYGAQLAQVVYALSPSANVVFVPVGAGERLRTGAITPEDVLKALDGLATDIPVILVPFGPLVGGQWASVIEKLVQMDRLVVVPASNSGGPLDYPFATKILVAESINADGTRSRYSSQVKGAIGAVGEFPTVELTDLGPTIVVGTGTAFAAAALAAVVVESVARQPTLKSIALRDVLIDAARPGNAGNPPVARVVISH